MQIDGKDNNINGGKELDETKENPSSTLPFPAKEGEISLLKLLPYNTIGIFLVACIMKYDHVITLFEYGALLLKDRMELVYTFIAFVALLTVVYFVRRVLQQRWEAEKVSAGEREVLVDLYLQTKGEQWNKNKNWMSNLPIREWYGVKIENEGKNKGRIRKLILPHNNLEGKASPFHISKIII